MNKDKQKIKSLFIVLLLMLVALCSCKNDSEVMQKHNLESIAEEWAEALVLQDGKIRYDMMSQKAREQFEAEQKAVQGENWDFNIGGSSPWVTSYNIEMDENKATITYQLQDSIPKEYTQKEILKFKEENDSFVVEEYLVSNLYDKDGRVQPVINKRGMDLDEGIWDFLWQTVVGFYDQSEWGSLYELEAYHFNITDVERTMLENGHEGITVDFGLQVMKRNPFCDPAETSYLKKVKEQGRKDYDILYEEYYQQKESNTFMRFTCEVEANTQVINEDTCYPDSFQLFSDDRDPKKITFEKQYHPSEWMYQEDDPVLWYCEVMRTTHDDEVALFRKILIHDVKGRTNNGYFRFDLEQGGLFNIDENAVILLGGAEEEVRAVTTDEWISSMLLGDSAGHFTIAFEKDEQGFDYVSKVREGYHPDLLETEN